MYALSSLDKLCATQRFFSKMLIEGKNLQSQCRQPSLQIKCKSLASCTCITKKKNHFKHFKNKKGNSKRFKFFKKKAKRDIESIFSEQDHTDPSTTFVLQEDLFDSEYSSSFDYSYIPESYQATPLVSHFGPQAPVRIRPDKYSKPVDVIAYFDTDERYKTAFCLSNAQYQLTTLPFGLKTAPSLFQKAVTRIFHPLLHSALIYIDDILLFSSDETSYNLLLQQFHDIVHHYGIMLSEKKSIVGRSEIEFLGMHISNGQYRPGPHLAVRLLDFPNSDLSVKQVQQFLGIVNYVRDFIPHVSHYTSVLSTLLKKSPPP
ncbi:hypothetical protein LWI29_003003 [Acer saccharum]|uniref:Reverse transcriptase domain-containing protein n=1 Tax=Acer saccharum TaxID=4024 RepID=A0AA39RJY3_ACESA|nr:hypothetical protein LWI29_003003 [Acer saccharum]